MWPEQVQDCVASQGYSTSLATLSMTARCRIHFTLDRSLFTWGECMIRNNSITGFHLSVFIFPTCRKMEWKGMEKEEKIVWKKLQPSKEMFDIDLDCEGGVQSQMCVFVIKQVWIFHLRQKARIFFFFPRQDIMFYCCFPARASQTSIFSQLQAMTSSFHRVIFFGRPSFWFLFFWKRTCMSSFEKWEGGFVCGFAFSQVPSRCLNQLLKSNWKAFKETPTFLITALPQTLILFQRYSRANEYF